MTKHEQTLRAFGKRHDMFIIRVVNTRRMWWTGYVVRVRKWIYIKGFSGETSREKNPFGNAQINEGIILK